MVDPAPLCGHRLRGAERLHPRQQFLVRRGNSDAAGIRPQPQGRLHQDRGRHLVVLHPDHHLLLHRQPGRLPHGGEDGHPDREGRRPGRAVWHSVRDPAGGVNHDLLQGLADRNLPENVEVRPDIPHSDSTLFLLRYMESKEPAVFVATYKEGVQRVLEGDTERQQALSSLKLTRSNFSSTPSNWSQYINSHPQLSISGSKIIQFMKSWQIS